MCIEIGEKCRKYYLSCIQFLQHNSYSCREKSSNVKNKPYNVALNKNLNRRLAIIFVFIVKLAELMLCCVTFENNKKSQLYENYILIRLLFLFCFALFLQTVEFRWQHGLCDDGCIQRESSHASVSCSKQVFFFFPN